MQQNVGSSSEALWFHDCAWVLTATSITQRFICSEDSPNESPQLTTGRDQNGDEINPRQRDLSETPLPSVGYSGYNGAEAYATQLYKNLARKYQEKKAAKNKPEKEGNIQLNIATSG